ncbi:hypothetical protein BG015_012038 [Linnemannia schmuckeri]|uniref:Uncharacterized protein n=1 Tax=Linnemannia schmuckeri TaxID=64567 RepID=A0A9P5S4A9_9FUNG|nr:hypothetical protein BG015_012038 [Linnemannia schmuckeri]
MSKSTTTTTTTTTNGSNSFLTHAQWIYLRQEAQLRRQTLATFGPQGVLDLALVGAILGNNIREIGRYSVTCDGSLVRGRYTIYELVHFGALAVTGRRRRRHHGSASSDTSSSSSSSDSTTKTKTTVQVKRIYPTTLSNLFPAMVFKAMRRKSVRPPKFQHDDEDDCYSSMPSTPTMFPMSPTFMATAAKPTIPSTKDYRSHSHSPTPSFASSVSATTTSSSVTATADAMLITSEAVLSHLIQHRLHRVKDLPLPRELCFMGAVSLPLPPVLRAMHIAWTMDFLKTCATTPRRQRKQQQQQQRQQQQTDDNDSTPSPLRSTPPPQQEALGGLEFRPDIYAHKMRLARLVRAQQQEKKATTSLSTSPPSSSNSTTATTPGSGYSHHRLSASMRRGPSSVSIPEENEDEDDKAAVPPTPAIPLLLNEPAVPVPTPISTPTPTPAATAAKKSVRQDKRLMQQLLALENKVPRIVRQWANVARTYFDNELIQEDREVQAWVDRQRIQVVLGCGYRFGGSPSNALTATTPSIASTVTAATAAAAAAAASSVTSTKGNGTTGTTSRPRLAPIATALANANVNANPHAIHLGATRHQRVPSLSSSTSPAPSRSCFPEGVRLVNSGYQQPLQQQQQHQKPRPQSTIRSRPTSATMNERLSASQQMLSMHLWLSLLVSPLSPEHMIQDQFSFLDS